MSKPPYLGLDIGLRRTGVALSESGLVAQPLTTLELTPPHTSTLIDQLVTLVRDHEIITIVAGVPLGEHDEPTEQAEKTTNLVDDLRAALQKAGLTPEIVTSNEFHSTQDALEHFPDTDKDAAAAALILQDYLEQNPPIW